MAEIKEASVIACAKWLMLPETIDRWRGHGCSSFGAAKDGELVLTQEYTIEGLYYRDGKPRVYKHDGPSSPCIAGINYFRPNDCLMHTAKCKANMEEVHEKFIRWCCGANSPWRDLWMDFADDIVVDGINVMSHEFNVKYGTILQHMGFGGNLMGSFYTVIRVCYEYPDTMAKWAALCDEGINPSYAFLLMCMFAGGMKDRHFNPMGAGHWAIEGRTISDTTVDNFIGSKPAGVNGLFCNGAKYTPVTAVWCKEVQHDRQRSYIGRLLKEYGGEKPQYGSVPLKMPLLEVAKLEQKRLGL